MNPMNLSDGQLATEPAFREHESGLLVPTEVSRRREVWARNEWATVERAVKLMKQKRGEAVYGVSTFYKCDNPACDGKPLALHRNPINNERTLRCGCTDRLMSRAF